MQQDKLLNQKMFSLSSIDTQKQSPHNQGHILSGQQARSQPNYVRKKDKRSSYIPVKNEMNISNLEQKLQMMREKLNKKQASQNQIQDSQASNPALKIPLNENDGQGRINRRIPMLGSEDQIKTPMKGINKGSSR